jgi:trans-aconitate methyltransferase
VKQILKQAVRRAIGEPYVGKRLKLRWLKPRLRELGLDPQWILDVGSEDATFTYWLARFYPGARIDSVDIDHDAIAACIAAQPRRTRDRIAFKVQPLAEVPSARYDAIVVFDVLEHIRDDSTAVRELARALRPRGRLLVHVPERTYVDSHGSVHEWTDETAWQSNPGHVRAGYTPEQLADLVIAAGLQVVSVERWNRRWSAVAHEIYARLEWPRPLRLLSIPITDVCAALDRRRPPSEGNTVWLVAERSG